jgi:WD40 repeat protein
MDTPEATNVGVQVAGSAAIGGDVVGRDKIINNIQNIHQRALTAAEEALKDQEIESQILAQGISQFVQRLQERASDTGDGTTDKGNPYKGLLEYRLSDADIFFGRQEAIAEVMERLGNGPLTILHAESGAGKTSLMQAGISPRLIGEGHLPIYLRPYNNYPGLILKRALISDPGQTPFLASAPLRDFLRQVSNIVGSQSTLYIFLDQFEEFFTHFVVEGREDFARELAECMEDESLNVRWLLALRTEYFGNLANLRPHVKNPFANDARLDRLTRVEAKEVVAAPAGRRGVTFEDGLVDQLLDDLGKNDFAPPQIQLVCSALFDELKSGQTVITKSFYDELEGAAGILREHLDRVLSRDVLPEARVAARRLLQALISSEQRRLIRTRGDLVTELGARGVSSEMLDGILSQLIDSRLLRVHEATRDVPDISYELAHDYLLEEIRLNPEMQARKAAQELLEQEVRSFKKFKTLLSDERLKVIDPYRHDLKYSPEAEELLRLSQEAAEQERADREAKHQKEIDDARALAEAQRQQAETEKKRAEEQTVANAKLARRNRIVTYFGVAAIVLAAIAAFAYDRSTAARAEADSQRATAIVASTLAVGQQQIAQHNSSLAATAEYSAITERDNAQQQLRLSSARALSAQSLALADTRADQSYLLSVQALNISDTQDARGILFTNLERDSYLSTFLRVHRGAVTDLAFSPAGQLLASASDDGSILIWEADTYRPIGSALRGHVGHINALAFSPDGQTLASGGDDGYVVFWNVATRQQIGSRLLAHTRAVNAVRFSPDGQLLASTSADSSLILWAVADHQAQQILLSPTADVPLNSVVFSKDGAYVLATDEQGQLLIWDVASGTLVRNPLNLHLVAAQGLALSPDGQLLASGGSEGDIVLWDMREFETLGPQRWLILQDQLGAIPRLAFSPNGQRLVSGSGDGTLIVWDVQGIYDDAQPKPDYLTGYSRPVTSVAFSPDNHTVISGYADGAMVVWDLDQFNPMGRHFVSHGDHVSGLAFSPDGQMLYSSSFDGRVIVWETKTAHPIMDLSTKGNPLLSMAYSVSGSRLAAGDSEGTIFVWNTDSLSQAVAPFNAHFQGVLSLAFSPDGNLLVSGGQDKAIRLWKSADGSFLKELSGPTAPVTSLAISPDGRLLASGSTGDKRTDNAVLLWDLSDPLRTRLIATLTTPTITGVYSLAFSPDGQQLAVGYENGTVLFWDMASRQVIGEPLAGQTRAVTGLTFGQFEGHLRLATVSADGITYLWDVESHLPVTPPLVVNYERLASVAYSADGTQLAAGGAGGLLAMWNVNPVAWRERACTIVGRNFTRNEWLQFFSQLQLEYQKTCEQWPLDP